MRGLSGTNARHAPSSSGAHIAERSISPTVTLSIIVLCSVGWSTGRGPNIGHFRAFLGSQNSVSGLLNGSLGLSGTVGLERVW